MKEILTYIFGVAVCGGVLTAFYSLLLERRVKFLVCRLFLPLSMVAAAVIPALKIPVWPAERIYVQGTAAVGAITAEVLPASGPAITAADICMAVYFAGVLLILCTMVLQLARIFRLRRNGERARFDDFEIVRVNENISSFSFFSTIYVSAGISSEDLKVIISHEAGHIRHRHSAERVAMEFIKAAQWWNPFVWIAARRLAEVQEYEADSDVLESGYDVSEYINTLLKHLFGYSPDIANGLRDSLTKKRLKMMTQSRAGRYGLLRTLAVVPTLGGLMALFSFTAKAAQYEPADIDGDGKPLIIVDGKPFDGDVNDIPATNIASMSIIKDDNAKREFMQYGDTSNGVVVLSTKDAPRTNFSGTVTDGSHNPIEGALVEVLGTKQGTVTDKAGRFTLSDIPETATIKVSFIGYESAIVIADNPQKNITFFLQKEDAPAPASAALTLSAGDSMPLFQGGSLADFRYWVVGRIRFPKEAQEAGVHGRVTAAFVIDSEGALGSIEILASPGEALSQEVKRVLSASPQWTPAKVGGKPASMRLVIPVDFAIYGVGDEAQPDSPAEASATTLDKILITAY